MDYQRSGFERCDPRTSRRTRVPTSRQVPSPLVRSEFDDKTRLDERGPVRAKYLVIASYTAEGIKGVIIEVRTLDGEVLRTIPPSKALGVAGGEAL